MLQSVGSQRVRRNLATEPPPPYIQALECILSSQDSFLACQVWGRLGTCPLPCLPGSLLFTTCRGQLLGWLLITFYWMREEGGYPAEMIPPNLQLGCLSPFHFSVHTGRPRRVA